MRGDLDGVELATPARIEDALALVADGHSPLAGGTDAMVLLAAGKLSAARWVDIAAFDELRGIEVLPDAIAIGALTTYADLRRSTAIAFEFPMLVAAAEQTGGWAIQNRGTLGGNIGNASPAADSPPALLAYDAQLELLSQAGTRRVPYQGFHLGYKRTAAAPGEIVARVLLPRRGHGDGARQDYYRKVGARQAQAISKVCMAASAKLDGGTVAQVRVALGGVAPVPVRCIDVECALLEGDPEGARSALAQAIAPIDDVRSTARYRRRVAENMLADFARLLGHHVELDG